jgi:BlaI family penicillinase repressor
MQISAAESQVMEALWQESPLTPEALIEAVGPANGWAPGTVRTLITRLLRKKAISGAREGDKYHYRPLIARSAYLQSESQGLLDRLFQGEVTPFVAHFAEHRNLTPEDVQKLKALIARMEDDDEG